MNGVIVFLLVIAGTLLCSYGTYRLIDHLARKD